MDENEKLDLVLERLEKLEKKVEDNNEILHGERNAKRWAKLFWLIKWIVIISLGILMWSYLEPVYKSTMETVELAAQGKEKTEETLKNLGDTIDKLKNLDSELNLENLKKKLSN